MRALMSALGTVARANDSLFLCIPQHDMGLGLTALLAKMFPFMAAAVESIVSEIVPPLLDKYKPKWMEG